MSASSLRFTRRAAATMRAAITEAGGIEIFCIGKLNKDGDVDTLEVHCRGNHDSVPALLSRPKSGEVVIHNHPSGRLEASQADMMLANRYGEDGVGVVIVDNTVQRSLWVVEPYRKPMEAVTEDEIRNFFCTLMPRTMPGYESRDAQVDMALRVAETLNVGNISVTEAGTGTGKSLAYLVPATLWALKNESRVAVATFTINLQSQLVTSDIPVMQRAGLEFRYALLKGRSNYICRRRLKEEAARENTDPLIARIAKWADHAEEGSRSDMAFPVEEDTWDLVASDHDQTLRARCPHFNECFYYQARREAANAHLIVVNHHLLLADLLVKSETGGDGILPRFDRLILDEGHHLEDAATSLFRQQTTARAIRRATGRLIPRRKRPGALERIQGFHIAADSPLPPDRQQVARKLADQATADLTDLHDRISWWMENLAASVLSPEKRTIRITPQTEEEPFWELNVQPTVTGAAERLARAAHTLGRLESVLKELPESFQLKDPQPMLDLSRSRRKIGEHASFLYEFLSSNTDQVRWIEEARGRSRAPSAALCSAPVEVGPLIRAKVFDPLAAIATCSATMTVDNRFDHFLGRVGLSEPGTRQLSIKLATLPSPFDYNRQALLGLPTDIP
ncbi:MAG: ATP-dependent DNA helicase DinG, partial [Myxococcota bacterium]